MNRMPVSPRIRSHEGHNQQQKLLTIVQRNSVGELLNILLGKVHKAVTGDIDARIYLAKDNRDIDSRKFTWTSGVHASISSIDDVVETVIPGERRGGDIGSAGKSIPGGTWYDALGDFADRCIRRGEHRWHLTTLKVKGFKNE